MTAALVPWPAQIQAEQNRTAVSYDATLKVGRGATASRVRQILGQPEMAPLAACARLLDGDECWSYAVNHPAHKRYLLSVRMGEVVGFIYTDDSGACTEELSADSAPLMEGHGVGGAVAAPKEAPTPPTGAAPAAAANAAEASGSSRHAAVLALTSPDALLRIAGRVPERDSEAEVLASVRFLEAKPGGEAELCRAIVGGDFVGECPNRLVGCSWAAVQGRPGFGLAGSYLGLRFEKPSTRGIGLDGRTFVEYADGVKDDTWLAFFGDRSPYADITGKGGTAVNINGIMAGWEYGWLNYRGCSDCRRLLNEGKMISSARGGSVLALNGALPIGPEFAYTNANLLRPEAGHGSLWAEISSSSFILLVRPHAAKVRRVSIEGCDWLVKAVPEPTPEAPSKKKAARGRK
jgi:hypothetical protein